MGARRGAPAAKAKVTFPRRGEVYLVAFDPTVGAGEGGLEKPSVVLLDQIRTVDRARLLRRLGTLRRDTMVRVDGALMISLALVEL